MFPELFSIAGKTALITGGTSGIGYMIAEGYLRAGARVYISSRKPEACRAAQEQLSEFGEVDAIPADVSSEEQCRALIDEVGNRAEALHILVNNAGATWGEPFDTFPARGVRQGADAQREGAVRAHPAGPSAARCRRDGRRPGPGAQHRLDRRSDRAATRHLLVFVLEGRGAPADPAPGLCAGAEDLL